MHPETENQATSRNAGKHAAARGVPKMARTEEKREDRPSSLLGEGLHDVLAFLCVRLRDDADEYIQDVHAERQRHEDHEPL